MNLPVLSMEAKLFWISMACGAYAFSLRAYFKREERLERWLPVAIVHGLFWALVGVVAGSLISSYKERPDIAVGMMTGFGAAGLIGGFLWRFFRDRSVETSRAMLAEDLEWADTGFSAILLASFIMFFFIQAFKIPSGSMRNTLLEGDHLFVNKFIYGFRVPMSDMRFWRFRPVERGDIVVFRFPTEDRTSPHYGKDFIKRAVGLPGDTVEIKRKQLFVNGVPVEEPYSIRQEDYIIPPSRVYSDTAAFQSDWGKGILGQVAGETVRDNFGPVSVPEGTFFVMGDNRDHSYDSRFWGPMPATYLKGKAWVLYLPFKRMRVIH